MTLKRIILTCQYKCTMLLAHSDYLVNIPHSNLSTVRVPLTDDLRHRILTYFANLVNGRNGTKQNSSHTIPTHCNT